MKTITKTELDTLKEYLGTKSFRYEEVYNEVIDHYATAYENSESSLDQVINDLDQKFSNKKIEEINTRYFNDLKSSLRRSHWTIFMGNFRWPQIVYTLLIALVCRGVAPFLMQSEWAIYPIFLILAFTPITLGFYYYFIWVFKKLRGFTRLKNGHAELFGTTFGVSVIYLQLPNIVREFESHEINLLLLNDWLTALILFFGVIMAISAISFTNAKLKPAIL